MVIFRRTVRTCVETSTSTLEPVSVRCEGGRPERRVKQARAFPQRDMPAWKAPIRPVPTTGIPSPRRSSVGSRGRMCVASGAGIIAERTRPVTASGRRERMPATAEIVFPASVPPECRLPWHGRANRRSMTGADCPSGTWTTEGTRRCEMKEDAGPTGGRPVG